MNAYAAPLQKLLLALAGLAIAVGAYAQQPLRQKLEYDLIAPQPTATGERIEVIEFFWYGCPHCANLQPPLEGWLKRKPADVELRRIPAVFRESWIPHARVYYTLEALGEVGRLHQAVYRAIHAEKDSLMTPEATAAWASRNGIEASRWLGVYNSPEIDRKIQDSRKHTIAYAIEGTPSLVVDGRYLTSSSKAESMPQVITILDGLIVMARDKRPGR
jgi:protein dithiol oxidoreductase (disulfide-forming)